ncbi:MAG: RuvA C-terminal domain-containing protein [Myxococcota bacterium]
MFTSLVADPFEEVVSALVNLGYPRNRAERVAEAAAKEAGDGASLESLIRVALKGLAK